MRGVGLCVCSITPDLLRAFEGRWRVSPAGSVALDLWGEMGAGARDQQHEWLQYCIYCVSVI